MYLYVVLFGIALFAVCFTGFGCDSGDDLCKAGDTQQCFCPAGNQSVQACAAYQSDWELCACPPGNSESDSGSDEGIEWCDTASALCWQDPPYQKGRGLCWEAANDYCDVLSFDGHVDWRLPNIVELRTLVLACPQLESGGACPLEDGSGWGDMDVEKCTSCLADEADNEAEKALDDCYWNQELQGSCNRDTDEDPAVEYWSSSANADDPTNWAAFIHFGTGTMGYNHTVSWGDVRCVRDKISSDSSPSCNPNDTRQCTCDDAATGAQKCSADGSGWGACVCIGPDEVFDNECGTQTTIAPEDCNTITVTVTVPDDFPADPFSLTGFVYSAERCCPPNGPPDGGWDVYENPVLTADTPFVMDVHGINIAKTECLPPGEYKVLITVMVNADDPIQQQDWRGFSDETVVLGNGDVEVTIELALE